MTLFLSYFREAAAALWRNRTRSILTMLGMIIGSASIIAVFGISRAAASGISSTLHSFGDLPVYIGVDDSQDFPERAAIAYRDIAAVATALGDRAAYVEPNWQRTYSVGFGNKHDYESIATDGSYHNDALPMEAGRELSAGDLSSGARVCVLTADLARKYFGEGTAVGNFLRVNGERCQVVGVYADIKGSLLNSLLSGAAVILPYTTFFNDFSPGAVDTLSIYPADQNRANEVAQSAIRVLQHVHGRRSQYTTQNGAGALGSFNSVLNVVATGLSAIGAVALLVAGIGIMNIMLVSVTERTREIGIRKAIGANRGNIAMQFLAEALLLSLLGGLTGMVLGLLGTLAGASLLSSQLGNLVIPYVLIVGIALTFSFVIGSVFGTYPAMRAAMLDPIEALRS